MLPSALKRFSARDIQQALDHFIGIQENYPRDGLLTVAGHTTRGMPVVVLIDMTTNRAFHAQKCETKYEHLFRQRHP